jgi:hypothetical protein
MKTYLIEAYNDNIEFDKDSIIIALTPLVCNQLDKKGVKYSIVEDFFSAMELSNPMVEEHRKSVFHWIEEFDQFLQNNIGGLGFKLATIHRWYLKGMVIDPLYARCFELHRLFQAISPTEIIFLTFKPTEPQLNDRFEHYGRSLYSQILPALCREKSIPLTTVLHEPNERNASDLALLNQDKSLVSKLKTTLFKNTFLKRMFFTYRYISNLPSLNKAGRNRKNIFIPVIAHIGEDFIAKALCRGHQVYLLSGNTIQRYSCFGMRKSFDIDSRHSSLNKDSWGKTAALLKDHYLVKWINQKCQLDVSEITLPRLRHFVSVICPDLISNIKQFTEFYNIHNMNLFLTPYVSMLPEYAALTAAKHSPQVTTACLTHGDGVYDSRVLNITELENYDIHISSNNETMEYFKNLSNEINSKAKLYSNPHRFRNLKRITRLRKNNGDKYIKKNRVVYLPLFFLGDYRRIEAYTGTDTWYYQFQKALIEYFATRTEFSFIWKGLLQSELIYNPIPDFIRDHDFTNTEIATNPFAKHLLTADRIICDCPSTGFYEAVFTGVPVMSLYHTATIIRPSAVKYFGNLLKPYSDIPEAIKHIENFLNDDDLSRYQMKFDVEKGSIFDILEGTS